MKWFGLSWGAPVCTPEDFVPAPVGVPCGYCGEPIQENDCGFVLGADWSIADCQHRECFLRQAVGSVAHLERRCSCFVAGSRLADPLGMSKRAAARAAVALYWAGAGDRARQD